MKNASSVPETNGKEPGSSTDSAGNSASSRGKILLVEDQELIRRRTQGLLEAAGYDVVTAVDEPSGRTVVDQHQFDLVLLDLGLVGDSADTPLKRQGGVRLFQYMRRVIPSVPLVIVTADQTAASAIELLQCGAYNYLLKPVNKDLLLHVAAHGVELGKARRRTEAFKEARNLESPRWYVGPTPRMREAKRIADMFAPTDAAILIQGPTGTGKEVVAHHIHQLSTRASGPFIPFNCSAVPVDLLESELFGHEKGAFTGAIALKRGRMELADGGTLFLDELATMPPATQVKLLRALEDFRFMRVGGEREIKVDLRLISATNRDIHEAIDAGDFRSDLYYRICVQPILLPPLAERAVDVAPLAMEFIEERRARGASVDGLTERAAWALAKYRWPGNVRELRNVIERAVVVAAAGNVKRIDIEHLPNDIVGLEAEHHTGYAGARSAANGSVADGLVPPDLPPEGLDLPEVRDTWEARLMQQALARTAGNQTAAARLLHMTRDMFRSRVAKFGLGDDTVDD